MLRIVVAARCLQLLRTLRRPGGGLRRNALRRLHCFSDRITDMQTLAWQNGERPRFGDFFFRTARMAAGTGSTWASRSGEGQAPPGIATHPTWGELLDRSCRVMWFSNRFGSDVVQFSSVRFSSVYNSVQFNEVQARLVLFTCPRKRE